MNTDLEDEARRATTLLKGKIVHRIWRHRALEICLEFTDGTRLFVDHRPNDLELSINEGKEDEAD